mmetsp:Transcript_2244/g.2627  ORF Transcript_2244/g.2627 Transcript_2244/m.2627 type:complete len:152 (+) Transcript_2244:40-495(+)
MKITKSEENEIISFDQVHKEPTITLNIINTQNVAPSLSPRKSRYDNSITPPNNTHMIPFHSQVFDDSSEEEDKEKSVELLPESVREVSPSDKPTNPSSMKLDIRLTGGLLPSLLQSKNDHDHINEEELFKTSIAPPKKIDSSAIMFSSPKK